MLSAFNSQPEEWDQTDEGHRTIYELDPMFIPASQAARVVYELRCDVTKLNDEVIELVERLRRYEP